MVVVTVTPLGIAELFRNGAVETVEIETVDPIGTGVTISVSVIV